MSKTDKQKLKPGYKLTAVGVIPKDWEVKPLGKLLTITSGKSPKNYRLAEKGVTPFIKVEELNYSNKNIHRSREYVVKSRDNSIMANSIIFPKRGAAIITNKIRINKVSVFMDSNMMAVTPDDRLINLEFLYNTLLHQRLYKIADTSTIPQINNKHIEPYKIPLPPIPEQQKIAEILSTWDRAIEKCEAAISALEKRNKGLAQQLLSGQKRLNGFEGDWEEYQFKDIIKEVKRPIEWDDEELYHLISVRRRSGGLFERDSLYGKEIKTKNLKTAKKDDFLISKMQIVHGAAGLVTEEFDDMKISGSYIAVRSKSDKILDIKFLNWYSKLPLFYHQTYTSSFGVHIEKMTFSFKLFLKEKILLPNIEEQQAIVEFLQQADQELELQKAKKAALQKLKEGLMQKLLTGEIRVKLKEEK